MQAVMSILWSLYHVALMTIVMIHSYAVTVRPTSLKCLNRSPTPRVVAFIAISNCFASKGKSIFGLLGGVSDRLNVGRHHITVSSGHTAGLGLHFVIVPPEHPPYATASLQSQKKADAGIAVI